MMRNPIRVALVGAWHVHANDYAGDCRNNAQSELIAVWDEDEWRSQTAAETWGVPRVSSLDALLDDPDLDGVIITTATARHRDVMLQAIVHGKHIFTEKVLAASTIDAEEIATAAARTGIVLTVSLPRLYSGYTAAIDEILASNELGEVTYLRVRVSHDGAVRREGGPQWLPGRFFDRDEAGGGAMIDFGAHPYYLVHHFLGMPDTVTAHYLSVSGHDVEDQAVVICQYPGRITALSEASFLGGAVGHLIEIHGTDGSLLFTFEEGLRTRVRGDAEWRQREIPADQPIPFDRWVNHIRRGEPDSENVDVALALTRLAEAAELSAREGRAVRPGVDGSRTKR